MAPFPIFTPMNIRNNLIREHSKAMAENIAEFVISQPGKLDELMSCFFDSDFRMCQRASWPVCKLGIKSPGLLERYIPDMIKNLENPNHDAVIRNTIRVWAEMDIGEEYEGNIFDICFRYLCNRRMPVAVRAFSISVAGNIAQKYPELANELISEFKNQLQYETKPAVLVRLRKYIKILNKVLE